MRCAVAHGDRRAHQPGPRVLSGASENGGNLLADGQRPQVHLSGQQPRRRARIVRGRAVANQQTVETVAPGKREFPAHEAGFPVIGDDRNRPEKGFRFGRRGKAGVETVVETSERYRRLAAGHGERHADESIADGARRPRRQQYRELLADPQSSQIDMPAEGACGAPRFRVLDALAPEYPAEGLAFGYGDFAPDRILRRKDRPGVFRFLRAAAGANDLQGR